MPHTPASTPADGPESRDRDRFQARRRGKDHAIARIAGRQHGLVTLDQLRRLGIDKDVAHQRVEAGRLHRVHSCVYSVGHPLLSREGRWMAAVLACGTDAMLSHRSAAELWSILKEGGGSIDVMAPNRRGRIPAGIQAHRNGSLASADRTSARGIRCTSVERTLLDLAGEAPTWELRQALAEAEVRHLLDRAKLRRLIHRGRGRRGVAKLRLLFEELDPATKRTRSELERRFLRACAHAGLPRPEVNVALEVDHGVVEADFLWRDAGLVVEADGRRVHDTDFAFEHDRRREQRLQLAGWRVSRCTWKQVERESRRLAETIRALIDQQKAGRWA